MRKINFLEMMKVFNYREHKWEVEYLDTFKKNNDEVEPMNWKSLEYYFRLYIGTGEVKIKVRNRAILIERVD